ncbi:MAG: hypothetical protein HYY59_04160 [Candidatus Omnitrophica bacterium]|nr:hypothetical protein [Candidatus Omnitrophota bacterium]
MSCSISFSPATADTSGTATSTVMWSCTNASNGWYSCSATTGTFTPISGWLYSAVTGPESRLLTFPGISGAGSATCTVTPYNEDGGAGSNYSATVTLTPLPTCILTLNGSTGTTVTADANGNASVPFNLTSNYATNGTYSCTGGISPLTGAIGGLSGTLSFSGVTSQQTHSCIITSLTGAGGTSTTNLCSATVRLDPPPPPTVDLRVNGLDTSVNLMAPADITLSWTSTVGSDGYCDYSIPGVGSGQVGPSGTRTFLNVGFGTYAAEVVCSNAAGGSARDVVAVNVTTVPTGTPVWQIRDSLGPIFSIDSLGNAYLVPTSQVNERTPPLAGLTGAFLLKRGGERVFAFSRNVTYLKGSVRPWQTGLTAEPGKLAIKNGSRQIVALFDGASGDLYLARDAVGGRRRDQ